MKTEKKTTPKPTFPNEKEPYFQEWLVSKVDPEIIELNVKYLSGNNPYEYLCYGLGNEERINTGVLKRAWLDRYSHIERGGWWCAGVNITNGFSDSDWGCFKPDEPKKDKKENKLIKYETPPKVPTEIFTLKVPDKIWQKISEHWEIEKDGDNFWEWVLKHRQIPILITEGAKKAGALLTAGYAAIALPGIDNGTERYQDEKGKDQFVLAKHLKAFCQSHREIIFAFDSDEKVKTQNRVKEAIIRKGRLYQEELCDVSVVEWTAEQGKGIDDFIANNGETALHDLIEHRVRLRDYIDSKTRKIRKFKALAHWLDYLRIEEFDKRLKFNELTLKVELDGKEQKYPDDLRAYFADKYSVELSNQGNFVDGIAYFAHLNAYDPVKVYLERVQKEAKRVDINNLATRFLKTNNPAYDRAFKAMLIGLVKRRYEPGCKHDYVSVIQGSQGTRKSTFVQLLGAGFASSGKNEMKGKDALMEWHSKWLHELDELGKFSNKEVSQVKSFITTNVDQFRAPYDRTPRDYPRGFALIGTVNELSFLRDHTGDRRFWIFQVPKGIKIDTETFAKEVDGIWASAMDAYQAGEKNYLTSEDEEFMTRANQRFKMEDAWVDEIANYCGEYETESGEVFYNLKEVSINEILDKALKIPLQDYPKHTNKVSQILESLNFEKVGQVRRDGKRVSLWSTPQPTQDFTVETQVTTPPSENGKGIDRGIDSPQALPDKDSSEIGINSYSRGIDSPQPLPHKDSSESVYAYPENLEKNFEFTPKTERQIILDHIKEQQERLEWDDENLKINLKRTFPHAQGTKSLTDEQLVTFWESLLLRKPARELNGHGQT